MGTTETLKICWSGMGEGVDNPGPIFHRVDNAIPGYIAIQVISVDKTNYTIHLIMIYPVDSGTKATGKYILLVPLYHRS